MTRWLLLGLVLLSAVPTRASACAMPELAAPVPLPGIVVRGRALATDVHLALHCARTDLANDSSVCHVEVRARLRAIDAIEIQTLDAATLSIEGDPVAQFASLEAGRTVQLALAFDRNLSVSTSDDDGIWVIPAPRARHMLVGQSSSVTYAGDGASGELFGGADVAIEGAIHVEAAPGAVHASVGGIPVDGVMDVTDPRGAITIAIDAPEDGPQVVQNGGPYVGVGIWGPIEDEGAPFALRVGYELGIADFVILGLGIETDFDSLAESVLVELASPELAILIPSFSAGAGLVARQLGPRDADAAVRLALGYQFLCFGAYTNFDYWPATGEWTIAAGGRISI